MIKKIIFILFLFSTFWFNSINASNTPNVNCAWLPWCDISWNVWASFIDSVVSEFIQIVAVFAVFALIISWFMYLLSWWDEEKSKKAKKWIIWSLVWVFLSISAWGIINILNNIRIG